MVFRLSSQGIYANTGSACASKALKTSPVLGAIGIKPEVAQGSLVFTLSRANREDEVRHVLEHLPPAVENFVLSLRSGGRKWPQEGLRMKLSTKSRYGTRLMLDMAQHYQDGPIHLASVAKRQGISVKYLEQIIIPLKKANYIRSVRGPKGGHILTKSPGRNHSRGNRRLAGGSASLSACSDNPLVCDRSSSCATRYIWQEAAQAMFDKLQSITLADLLNRADALKTQEHDHV